MCYNCGQDEHAGEDTEEISTRSLKEFISKRKWQVSCPKCLFTLYLPGVPVDVDFVVLKIFDKKII